MKLGNLSYDATASKLTTDGLRLRTGPFITSIRTHTPELTAGLQLLYADHILKEDAEFSDFHIGVDRPRNLRRWLHPQIFFYFDEVAPFNPFPSEQALPLFEWGLNWAISQHAHQYLIIHAAVIEKDGHAVIMPAPPGSGKSTLCAGLVHNGWRLLSDELTLLDLHSGQAVPLARPVGLKNDSIEVIRHFAPQATLSPMTVDTHKGAVALMKPPAESVEKSDQPAHPAWVIFPKYIAGAAATLTPHSKAEACIALGDNAFNYSIHGVNGFNLLTNMLDHCDCYDFSYSNLSDAVSIFSQLEPPA